MTIEAKIIADSVSEMGIRLTTMQLRYPRFIHAEFMTHRVFSRNASSSRAIPVARMIEDLRRDPAMPVFWGSNKPGMQAGAELSDAELLDAKEVWLLAMGEAIEKAEELMAIGLHKQIANRILEPWAHINVVVTATDWENFYTLRRHKDAQPEIKALADAIWVAQQESEPRSRAPGFWHLPYVRADEFEIDLDTQIKMSVARCARVSYLTHEGKPSTLEEDLMLYDRLVGAQPLHASPAEHQATPDDIGAGYTGEDWQHPEQHGNLRGWRQHRKMLEGEFIAG